MGWRGRFDRLFIGGDWIDPTAAGQIEVISQRSREREPRAQAEESDLVNLFTFFLCR